MDDKVEPSLLPSRATTARLTVYWRPGCGYCRRLRRSLARAGVAYDAVDIWQDGEARAFVRSVANGDETVPTVQLDDEVWINPPPEELLAMLEEQAPDLLSKAPTRNGFALWRRAR